MVYMYLLLCFIDRLYKRSAGLFLVGYLGEGRCRFVDFTLPTKECRFFQSVKLSEKIDLMFVLCF